ncbi:MAG: peptidoglycan-binding domain-containing protein [Candidatus Paceibacterota bacterium]|jgi:hypothetical protein
MSIKIFNTLKIFLLSLIVLLSAGYMSVTVIHAQVASQSMPTITITAPTINSIWDFGNTKTIAWQTTKLLSSVKGQIFLTKKDATSLTSGALTRYLVVNNLPNTGSYVWSSVGNVYALNKSGFTSLNETCNQTMPPVECYTIATKIPAGIYVMNIWFSADPADIFPTNPLGQFIVNGSLSNIVGMMTVASPGVSLQIGTIVATTTTTTTTSTTLTPGCTGGNLFDPITGKSCSVVTLPQGCRVGDLFNGKTGKPCVAGVTPINPVTPGCPVGALYNGITGKPCVAGVHSVTSSQNISTNTSTSYYNFGTLILKRGSSGIAVTELQRFLNDKESFSLVLDGKFGPKTQTAVIQFQQQNGLKPDGIAGPKTKAKMNTVL